MDDFAVERTRPGEYSAEVRPGWDTRSGPNGGYLLAFAVRALAAELPFPDPIVTSVFYLRPGAEGPARIAVQVIRVGRRVATASAMLSQERGEVLRATASFADLSAAPADDARLDLASPPALPPPEECVSAPMSELVSGARILERFEYRYPRLPGWLAGRPGGVGADEFWLRFGDGRAAAALDLPVLVDVAPPPVLDFGFAGSATVQLTVHVRARPRPGWLACRAATRHVGGGYHEEDFEIWDAGGTLLAQSRQLAVLR